MRYFDFDSSLVNFTWWKGENEFKKNISELNTAGKYKITRDDSLGLIALEIRDIATSDDDTYFLENNISKEVVTFHLRVRSMRDFS